MPIGLSTHVITDDQMSASSSFDDNHQPQFARLLDARYWRPAVDDAEPWLQVSFRQSIIVSAVVVDGDWSIEEGWIWLERFFLMFSGNGETWNPYVYSTDGEKVRYIVTSRCWSGQCWWAQSIYFRV